MNSRIEIIFDASGSMDSPINGRRKIDIAKEIFRDYVINEIKHEKNVFLRVLPEDCGMQSRNLKLGRLNNQRLDSVNNISIKSMTPLYQTIQQAINLAIDDKVTELKLIILSDGGDSCGGDIDLVLNSKKLDDSNLMGSIIIELGKIGSSGLNSLQALSSRIKGTRIPIGVNGRVTKKDLLNIKKGLVSARIVEGKLSKCFGKSLGGDDMSWNQLNEMLSINKFHAVELRNAKLLSFDPYKDECLKPYQVQELEFLSKIVHKNNLGIQNAINMMHNLEKPYFYSHDCISWDFNSSRWEKIINSKVSEVKISDFKDEEILNRAKLIKHEDLNQKELFDERTIYGVECNDTDMRLQFTLNKSKRSMELESPKRVINLKLGDLIEFSR